MFFRFKSWFDHTEERKGDLKDRTFQIIVIRGVKGKKKKEEESLGAYEHNETKQYLP